MPASVRRVLDVGCHTGAFGEALNSARDVEVWGVEPNIEAARQAATRLDNVICAPFSDEADIPDTHFDAVVFNDVLEHLVDPWHALRLAQRKLTLDGCVVASIPNLRHIENLMHIALERDFRYELQGIRDETHLRFFTKISIPLMFEASGFDITVIEGINENWWTPSILRRLIFCFWREALDDTKFVQFAVVATPKCGSRKQGALDEPRHRSG